MHNPLMQTAHHLHKTILALAIYIFPRRKISLSLLIKMAHNLHIGQTFEDFGAFEGIQVAKSKALVSFAVTAKLICVFVFA